METKGKKMLTELLKLSLRAGREFKLKNDNFELVVKVLTEYFSKTYVADSVFMKDGVIFIETVKGKLLAFYDFIEIEFLIQETAVTEMSDRDLQELKEKEGGDGN